MASTTNRVDGTATTVSSMIVRPLVVTCVVVVPVVAKVAGIAARDVPGVFALEPIASRIAPN
ncbi:Asp23/Gls24 family envelope stress response protein, partial [Curtobacterium sp. CT11-133]